MSTYDILDVLDEVEYDEDGTPIYDPDGYDIDGYDRDGFNSDGWDEDGYDITGHDEAGCTWTCGCPRCDPDRLYDEAKNEGWL